MVRGAAYHALFSSITGLEAGVPNHGTQADGVGSVEFLRNNSRWRRYKDGRITREPVREHKNSTPAGR